MKALILAGGFATRLWPLTKERPKPLLLMNGKPLISHILDKIPAGVEVYVSTNKKFERDFLDWKKSINRRVHLIIEPQTSDEDKLGAIGSIGYFLEKYNPKEDTLVIAGDNFFHFNITDFLKNFKGLPLIAAHNIKNYVDAKRYGVIDVAGARVVMFEEKPKEPRSTLISVGVYLFPTNIFMLIHDYLRKPNAKADNLGSFIEFLLKKTEVRAYIFSEEWFDIGSFEGYLEAHKHLRRGRRSKEAGPFYGVDFVGDVRLRGSVFIDEGSLIQDSDIEDSIILGECVIKNSKIMNSIIDEDSNIKDSIIKNELIEKGSRVIKLEDKNGS